MATTEATNSVSSPVDLAGGNEPVLTLLAEISGSLKDLNAAFKDHSERILKLESDRVVDNWGRRRSISITRREAISWRRPSARFADLRRDGSSQRDETSSYESYTDSDDVNEVRAEKLRMRTVNRRRLRSERIERRKSRRTGPRNQTITVKKVSKPSPERRVRHSSNDEVVIVEEVSSDSKSQDGGTYQNSDGNGGTKGDANIAGSWRHPLTKYTTEEVKYGDWPQDDLCQQLFGDLPSKKKEQTSAWLREKRLVFPRDERCSFTFDTVALAQIPVYESAGPLESDGVRNQIGKIEDFARDLRSRGGFFFFRESYDDGDGGEGEIDEDNTLKGENKIHNGTHVFRCEDGTIEALPKLSEDGRDFCEEPRDEEPRDEEPRDEEQSSWRSYIDDSTIREVLEKRVEMTREIEFLFDAIHDVDKGVDDSKGNLEKSSDGGSHPEMEAKPKPIETGPEFAYLYKGAPYTDYAKISDTFPRAVKVYANGWESPIRSACKKFRDPHIIAPWRRLCVITGLSRTLEVDGSSIWHINNTPIFPSEPVDGRFNIEGDKDSQIRSGGDQELTIDDMIGFYNRSTSQHLDCEQLSLCHISRRVCLQFQFSWYELVSGENSDKRLYSGKLYRDNLNRSLQLQSFMAIATWKFVDEHSTRDCRFWTLVIMAPAFYYHRNHGDKSDRSLIAPLRNSLPTLSAILSDLISRILGHWTRISEYVEGFIVGQDTILHEDEHDRLLFDDDTFTRSRQYFWVIASIGEFVTIIDGTLDHYVKIIDGMFPHKSDMGAHEDLKAKHQELLKNIVTMKERFERQRVRATALRDGLFNASAVVESRISTRLAQNVKLLTYVSIFYLPLGFCAALWAIPNITFPSTRTPFIVTALLVGLATYFIVFNLDSLALFGWARYSTFRKSRIDLMTRDKSKHVWRERDRVTTDLNRTGETPSHPNGTSSCTFCFIRSAGLPGTMMMRRSSARMNLQNPAGIVGECDDLKRIPLAKSRYLEHNSGNCSYELSLRTQRSILETPLRKPRRRVRELGFGKCGVEFPPPRLRKIPRKM